MPFDLIIFDYDGVLVDSLEGVIDAGQDYCLSIGHGRTLTKEIVTTLKPMTYDQLAHSIGLPLDQIEPFSEFVFKRLQQADASIPFFPGIKSMLRNLSVTNIVIISGNSRRSLTPNSPYTPWTIGLPEFLEHTNLETKPKKSARPVLILMRIPPAPV